MKLSYLGMILGAGVTVHAAVTGSKQCNRVICITGQHDDSTNIDTYSQGIGLIVDTLAPPSSISRDDFGYMAIGFGSKMANAPMIIVWPNSDGSITLSQRSATGNVAPSVVSNPARVATLNTASSFSNTFGTSFTFSLPSNSSLTDAELNQTTLIWAWSATNPDSSSSSASIVRHSNAGSIQMPLLATLSGATTSTASQPSSTQTSGSNTSDGESGGSGSSSSNSVLLAHAVCGGLATLFFLPLGTIIPRVSRGFNLNRWWFAAHGIINGLIGGALIITAYAIAQARFHDGTGEGSTHRTLGLVVFILILVQIVLGPLVHWVKSPFPRFTTKSGRGISNIVHIFVGIAIIALGFAITWTGMVDEWPMWSANGGNVNVAFKNLWGISVGLTGLIYLVGLVWLLPKQRKMERGSRLKLTQTNSPGSGMDGLTAQEEGVGPEMRSLGR